MSLGRKIFLASVLMLTSLCAEVEQVTLIWQPGLCQGACVRELYRQLGKIRGVKSVDINEGVGRAFITWQPDAPFSFYPINNAVRFVGIRVNDIRLKVRGHITGSAHNLQLISEGDNTSFTLLNPLVPSMDQYSVRNSAYNRQLSPRVADELMETSRKRQIVTVEGQFFEPYRSPPNNLVVERITVSK